MRQPSLLNLRLLALAIFGVALAVACVARDGTDPLHRARVLSVQGDAFARLLERGMALPGTPIAGLSEKVAGQIEGCDEVWAHFEDPGELKKLGETSAIRCAAPAIPNDTNGTSSLDASLAQSARQLRGEHDGLLIWPINDDGHIEIRFDVAEDGSLEIEGVAEPPSDESAFRLLIPSDEPPAAPVLPRSEALVYARARPEGGLALSKLIPAGSQGDRLFALKGRLLEGALLDGTWEFAFMPPAPGSELPLATLALHHRIAAPVREALNEALDQLERTWPIRRTARAFTDSQGERFEGGCYFDLPLLPGLAPCWVVTDEALLVGYRDLALEASLSAAPSPTPSPSRGADQANAPGDFGGLEIQLSGLTSTEEQPATPTAIQVEDKANANGASDTPTYLGAGDLYSDLWLDVRPNQAGQIALRGELRAAR